MISNSMKVLQDCMDLLRVVPGPCGEAHLACSCIKIEEDMSMDVPEEKDPLLIPFPIRKTEQEVSCMSVYTVTHVSQMSIVFIYLCQHRNTPFS
jgi:hypothetical protein